MRPTLITAAAYFAFAMTGAVVAEETTPAVSNAAVLENIYGAMEKTSAEALNTVVASAETRIGQQVAVLEEQSEPKPAITVASN